MEKPPNEDDVLRECLSLLRAYHTHGGGYISWNARQEQGLAPLFDPEERKLASTLLDLPDDDTMQRRALRRIGLNRALDILTQVVKRPRLPAGASVWHFFPYLEWQVDKVTLLLAEVQVGLTGLVIETKLWTSVPEDVPIPEDPSRTGVRIAWDGIGQVTDDCGTQYMRRGMTVNMARPLRVSSPWWTGTRLVQTHRDIYITGVPPEAHQLSLIPAPLVRVTSRSLEGDIVLLAAGELTRLPCIVEVPASRRTNLALSPQEGGLM
jgi:hypothetical protein